MLEARVMCEVLERGNLIFPELSAEKPQAFKLSKVDCVFLSVAARKQHCRFE
jgi:hypothetical protein